MDEKQQQEFAVLAKTSYDNYYNKDVEKELRQYGLEDKVLSRTRDSLVLERPNKQIVISYRGTNPKDVRDLVDDFGIIIGGNRVHPLLGNRFKAADKVYQEVKTKYPGQEIITTGHSLGGQSALYVSRKNDSQAIVFNPGASIFDLGTDLVCRVGNTCDENKKSIIYTTGKDPLSILGTFGKEKVITVKTPLLPKDLIFHSLNYFLPDKVPGTTKFHHQRVDYPEYLAPKPNPRPPNIRMDDCTLFPYENKKCTSINENRSIIR
jgi:hypothetical protein